MRTVVVGASSGLGRCIAIGLAQRGAHVAMLARRRERLEAAAREAGSRSLAIECDVTDQASCGAAIDDAASGLGGIDALVYTPAIGPLAHLVDTDAETWRRVFDTNVRGAFSSIRVQIPELAKTRGSIILTSSTAGSRGFAQAAVYTASKHAIEGIMRAATHELAPQGIRVNVVAPGPTATGMLDRFTGGRPELLAARVPLGRAASAEEVAEAVVWLASDEARFVNGAVVPVNGGLTA